MANCFEAKRVVSEGNVHMSLRAGKSKRWKNGESEFRATIEYVSLPEEMKHGIYREWVRLYIKSEVERLKRG